MTHPIDHFIYAGRDLEPMCNVFEARTGVKPDLGGRHPGLGTRNAVVSLGDSVYFELLALDAEQPLGGALAAQIEAFTTPRLYACMLRADDLETLQQILAAHAIESDLFEASRAAPDGRLLRWRLLVPRANHFGEFVPRFIDWQRTTHPATTSVAGCRFESFRMEHPQAQALGTLLRDLQAGVSVQPAERPALRLTLATPRGAVVLTSDL